MRGTPVEVIKGPVTGLPIPANAEIVIEGSSSPTTRRRRAVRRVDRLLRQRHPRPEPVLDIKAIYHRNEPILLGVPEGLPDEILYRSLRFRRSAWNQVQKAVCASLASGRTKSVGARLLLAVAVNQRYPGHAKQAGHIASMCHVGAYCGRYTIVVDDDIDVPTWKR